MIRYNKQEALHMKMGQLRKKNSKKIYFTRKNGRGISGMIA